VSAVQIAILATTGLVAGVFGTLVGIGGGIIFVPVFLLVFHFTPQQAIGTSLMAVFFNALSGSLSYLRQRRVDIRAGWKFAVATLPGAGLGAWLARFLTSGLLELVFGLFLIAMALFVFLRVEPRRKEKKGEDSRVLVDSGGETHRYVPRERLGIALSFVVGIISSLLGIGGGIIHVPALIFLLGFPVHIATATSHFVLAISTFFGSISHFVLGNTLVLPAIIVGIPAIFGAQLGAFLSRKTESRLIARFLSLALILAGLRLFLKGIGVF
jgi:uncharacterized membrane protein YfcA